MGAKQTAAAAPALAFPGCRESDLAGFLGGRDLAGRAFYDFMRGEVSRAAARYQRTRVRPGTFDADQWAQYETHRARVNPTTEEVRIVLRVDDGADGVPWALPLDVGVALLLGPAPDNPEAQLHARLQAEADAREAARRNAEAIAAHRRDQAERDAEHARQRERWAGLDRFTRAAIRTWHQANGLPESVRADVSPIALLADVVRRYQIEPERVPDRADPPCRLELVLGWPGADSIEVDRPRDRFDAEEARMRERMADLQRATDARGAAIAAAQTATGTGE